MADPFTVFQRTADLPGAFFLDSSTVDYSGLSQWSFIGAAPDRTFTVDRGEVTVSSGGEPSTYQLSETLSLLRHFLAENSQRHQTTDRSQPPLASGAVGFVGYEAGGFFEDLPSRQTAPIPHPEIWFGDYPSILAYRHSDQSWWIGHRPDREPNADLISALEQASEIEPQKELFKATVEEVRFLPAADQYYKAVDSLLDHIRAGDIYQANLCRQVELTVRDLDPLSLYGSLRRHNPAPFSCAIKVDSNWILSSSPERFLSVDNDQIEARPIKGTTARSADPLEDRRSAETLLASNKDSAELTMIVDVLRNDLGRICEYGSVELLEHRSLESYAKVHHLVSTVRGTLKDGVDFVDILRATFPGGSITGAPKIKAMEILAELEPFGRGLYTGTIGYIDDSGRADFNIAIRTMIASEDRVSFGVGGGIVADSEPEKERLETLNKASALFDALGIATPDF